MNFRPDCPELADRLTRLEDALQERKDDWRLAQSPSFPDNFNEEDGFWRRDSRDDAEEPVTLLQASKPGDVEVTIEFEASIKDTPYAGVILSGEEANGYEFLIAHRVCL